MENMNKHYQGLSAALQAALIRNNPEDFTKVAQDADEILQTGSYMYGAARQVMGILNGKGSFDLITDQDSKKFVITPEDKNFKIRMEVDPDMAIIVDEAIPLKLDGNPYLNSFSGRYVEGYISRLGSEMLVESEMKVKINPFDYVKQMKTVIELEILAFEDRYLFNGLYGLVREVEDVSSGTSITATTKTVYKSGPHKAYLDLRELHTKASRMNQPFDMVVMPEARYQDYAAISDSDIQGISRQFLDNGFGTSTDQLPLYQDKKLMLKGTRAITLSLDPRECMFDVSGIAADGTDVTDTNWTKKYRLLRIFGYNCTDEAGAAPTSGTTLYANILARYGINLANVTKMQRILSFSPINYTGRIYNYLRDIKTVLESRNGFVSSFSEEYLTILLHNKYAVSSLDIWE